MNDLIDTLRSLRTSVRGYKGIFPEDTKAYRLGQQIEDEIAEELEAAEEEYLNE